ncbi:hypothetical protein GCM10009801_26130 [Streptomyces albiaxialis]|uniref:Uncharacterized protein n=1 Tax=Streptomyces albiaxialis TaxID=329523 RepID=A0ABN2VUA4_9ACTN
MVNEQPGKDIPHPELPERPSPDGAATKLGHPRSERALLLGGLPLVGAALGVALPFLARQLVKLPTLPMEKLVEFVATLGEAWHYLALAGAGLVLGVVCGLIALTESLEITLTDARVEAEGDGTEESLAREDVAAVFVDGKQLVVLGRDSGQLLRAEHAAPAAALAAAFRAHGYPWYEADPYAALYRRWIPHSPDTGPELNALLTARKDARKRKDADDVRDLTRAAERLGYAVRDKDTDQFWRPLVPVTEQEHRPRPPRPPGD